MTSLGRFSSTRPASARGRVMPPRLGRLRSRSRRWPITTADARDAYNASMRRNWRAVCDAAAARCAGENDDRRAQIILQVRSKAGVDGDGVYTTALISAPAEPSPINKLGKPDRFGVELYQDGSLKLTWKCKHPDGAVGTTYHVETRSAAASAMARFRLSRHGWAKRSSSTKPFPRARHRSSTRCAACRSTESWQCGDVQSSTSLAAAGGCHRRIRREAKGMRIGSVSFEMRGNLKARNPKQIPRQKKMTETAIKPFRSF